MSDERWEQINRAFGSNADYGQEPGESNTNEQQAKINRIHKSEKTWFYVESGFTLSIGILTVQAGMDASGQIHIPGDGKNHFYFLFFIQLLILNMIPHNAAKSYMVWKMRGWQYRRVKIFENSLFIIHSVMVFFTWILGFSAYHAG